MLYRRCGRSGLRFPAISLGLFVNFGHDRRADVQREVVRRAFDLGITHFDLANNYGPPPGAAETRFGEICKTDLRGHRDEILISTKAGYEMWQGPYGNWGSRKYLLASLDQSLTRLGVPYVDIFYSHRPDPNTPLEETMGALSTAVKAGKALYAGVSNYPAAQAREAARILKEMGTPLLINQPRYSMIQRSVEAQLLPTLGDEGVGCIAFSVLAQGALTDKYLSGMPADARLRRAPTMSGTLLTANKISQIAALAEIAKQRRQSLAQMALSWALRDTRMTSLVVGASSVAQLEENLGALDRLEFEPRELAQIDAASPAEPD